MDPEVVIGPQISESPDVAGNGESPGLPGRSGAVSAAPNDDLRGDLRVEQSPGLPGRSGAVSAAPNDDLRGDLRVEQSPGLPGRVSTVSQASEGVSLSRRAVAARNKRANETPEEAEERKRRRREADRARREARQQSQRHEDVVLAEQQRERNRAWMMTSRERESVAERRARLAAVAARASDVRSQESDFGRRVRLSQMAVRANLARSQEDGEERSQRLDLNAVRMAVARSQEDEVSRSQRRNSDAARAQNRRSNESAITRDERLSNLRASFRAAQQVVQAANLSIGRRVREPEQNDIGRKKPRNRGMFSECCRLGKVHVDVLYDTYPEVLRQLFMGIHPNRAFNRNFRDNIRKFNGMFAMASMEAKTVQFPTGGPYCYKVQGQIHHTLNLAAMADQNRNERPKYGQLFIMDTNDAIEGRFAHPASASCNRNLAAELEALLRNVNPYVQAYRMMFEVEQEFVNANHGAVPHIRLLFNTEAPDQNRFNVPRVNEVAAVFVSPDGNDAPPPSRLMMHPRGMALRELKITNPFCTPMSYPLFFANGGFGWNSRDQLDEAEMKEETSAILHGGRLFQQFLVDGFVKVEQERLEWQRQNQDTLRADSYLGLHDYLDRQSELQGVPRGKTVILASSFNGGDRYFTQAYQDAMAIVREFGTPDLFVTFTCNPAWREIVDNLKPGQAANDRPDLVAKVFKLKMDEFMDDICKKGVLGKVTAYVKVVEFQKRGLPHIHMLLMLREEDKLRTPEQVNSLVWAEIPDPTEFPRLHEIVTRHMMHGPCGNDNLRSPCMEKLKTRGQKPRYRRRESAPHFVGRNGVRMDSKWVVPYNPYLLTKYNAHINVEVCTSIKCVKYLFKYVYKGHDKANLFVVETNAVEQQPQHQAPEVLDHDEIKNYTDARYVGAPEAAWRIQKYDMQDKSHHVERLAVHLEGEQLVYFRESDHDERVIQRAQEAKTTLTAWFELNRADPEARQISYCDIPKFYTWNKKDKKWKKRERGYAIGRMYSVSPKEQERYRLRLLLLNVKGAISFENLRTVRVVDDSGVTTEVTFGTYSEAAKALGLLRGDEEWEECMREASAHQMPFQLRTLFVVINVNPYFARQRVEVCGNGVYGNRGATVAEWKDHSRSFQAESWQRCGGKRDSPNTRRIALRDASLIIVDEASMVSRKVLEAMDRKLREIMRNDVPFGGKIILLGGDFRQVLPVKRFASKGELIDFCLKSCDLWPLFKTHSLLQNMRVRPDQIQFKDWLLNLGDNKLFQFEEDKIVVPNDFLCRNSLAQEVFGECIANDDIDEFGKRAILASKNERANEINMEVLSLLPGETVSYRSIDSVHEDATTDSTLFNGAMIPTEFLNSVTHSSLPPHELMLKKNCVVMLLRNLNLNQGLANGTRLRVLDMRPRVLICKILSGDKAGETVFIPRITVTTDDGVLPFKMARHQFPVRLGSAMTINKSQGQTFDFVGIDLVGEVFAHGQLYVAFSRATSSHGVRVKVSDEMAGMPVILTRNVVYNEVL
ncbi:hypothetical protein L596_029881 [Steinernema carpocapsae]|uniref:ATP-dependent DNA helicase n=1 Tax=Steinernema carpocapsae TaxID=34508 RepID=A0A4U5LR28_STECR|nr:hypothetical protein L596_029881 [Steinernema carpocapsae]